MSAISNAVLLQIAGEIAFDVRVNHQRRALPLEDIRSADVQVPGIVEDIPLRELIQILANYELINIDRKGQVSFRHEKIADYLAGPKLAKEWRKHLHRLNDSISDDAWVFAAVHVEDADKREYLREMQNADPLLATRCAVKMGGAHLLREEKLAIQHWRTASSIFEVWRAANRLVALKTNACRLELRNAIDNPHIDSERLRQARGALAHMLDVSYLEDMLDESELRASAPGISASGGEIELWQRAPAFLTLSLARKRLKKREEVQGICLSLETIGVYGDESDVPVLEEILLNSNELKTTATAFGALREHDIEAAVRAMRGRLGAAGKLDDVFNYEALQDVGEAVDCSTLLSVALGEAAAELEDLSDESARVTHEQIRTRAIEVLGRCELTSECENRLVSCATSSEEEDRRVAWEIATHQGLPSFDELCRSLIAEHDDLFEIRRAVDFASQRASWTSAVHEDLCNTLAENLSGALMLQGELNPHALTILEYVLEHSTASSLAGELLRAVEKKLDAYDLANQTEIESKVNDRTTVESHEKFRLRLELVRSIGSLAAIADEIPAALMQRLLRVRFDSFVHGDLLVRFRRMVSTLSLEEVEIAIASEEDVFRQAWMLYVVSATHPMSDTLHKIFVKVLSRSVQHPALLSRLEKVAEAQWSDSMCASVVEALAIAKWNIEFGDQSIRRLIAYVAEKVTPELAEEVVLPRLERATEPIGKLLLQLLYDLGMEKKRKGRPD